MTRQNASAAGEAAQPVRECCERIGVELENLLKAFAPSDEVLTHFKAARIEMLKGLRAAIDARIDQIAHEREKGKSVNIE